MVKTKAVWMPPDASISLTTRTRIKADKRSRMTSCDRMYTAEFASEITEKPSLVLLKRKTFPVVTVSFNSVKASEGVKYQKTLANR